MHRRSFIKTTTSIALSTLLPAYLYKNKSHIMTLSFDDGFKKSFHKIANTYEKYQLKGCLNVIASGHFPDFQKVDDWILPELMGDFNDWNTLVGRGHEVMPHSWKHLNLARQPHDEAVALITKCLDYFEEHLEGYDAKSTIFNFPFNSSTPELEAFVLSKVGGLRSRGESAINDIPLMYAPTRLSCWSNGPVNQDDWVAQQIEDFLNRPGGWLILNLHGLEDEGWGPISEEFLDQCLARLTQVDYLEVMPTGEVLGRLIG